MKATFALALPFLLALCALPAAATNVDLVTLPHRETVQLTIYNSEDLTLVQETRHVTLKRGLNQLQFSWAGTLIDPTSVEFRPLEHAAEIEVADTVFPGQKPQHLVWNVDSRFEGEVRVEVSYFTSGLTWTMDYVLLSDPGETTMDFTGHVRVYNRSGEDYDNAAVRLIVGRVNLVEKIAELARRRGIPVPKRDSARFRALEKKAGLRVAARAEAALDKVQREAKGIVKEGLSEYFMFRVKGTETITDGWSKRMRAVFAHDAAFSILYRMRRHQYGPRPVRFFLWRNDVEHGLGDSPLPNGRVRVFRRDETGGMSFLGEQLIRYVPIRARIEVNLGPDDLVVYETRRVKTKRSDFAFRRSGNREYVSGWDEETRWLDTIRNDRRKPIAFELRRVWPGDVDASSEIGIKLFDYHTLEATFAIAPREKALFPLVILSRLGTNKKQERVTLR